MIDNISKLTLLFSVVIWISYTIWIIVPKLESTQLIIGLSAVTGILGSVLAYMEKKKSDNQLMEKEFQLQEQELNLYKKRVK